MSYFKLQPNGLNNAVKDYPGLANLERILSRNVDRFHNFVNLGNRTVPNQNVLVQFLQSFSVNVEWSRDYLINEISSRSQQLASLVDMTSLYNRGKNHTEVIYPESNHNTLLVVPFGNPSDTQINSYFSIPLDELVPLYPIYTTDTQQRWDIIELLNTQSSKAPEELFTIINVDIYALIIGFYRWLKRGADWGNSPHGYLANFPLANCYIYHNELVNYNYLCGNTEKIEVNKGNWNLESYLTQLTDYVDYKHRYLLINPMKSFTHFSQVNHGANPEVDVDKMLFPEAYKSLYFVQMSWVWSLASLGMVENYLYYNNILGSVDGQMKSGLDLYYTKVQLQSQLNQIKSDVWRKHFDKVWTRVRDIKP